MTPNKMIAPTHLTFSRSCFQAESVVDDIILVFKLKLAHTAIARYCTNSIPVVFEFVFS